MRTIHSGESVMGSPIPGKEHGENMDHFFSMFLEKHEKKIINYVFSYVYRNDLIMFLLRVCACSQHGKAPLMTKKGSFRHIFLQITLVKHWIETLLMFRPMLSKNKHSKNILYVYTMFISWDRRSQDGFPAVIVTLGWPSPLFNYHPHHQPWMV